MGHVEERDANAALNLFEHHLHLPSEFQVQRAERLIEKQNRGLQDQRTAERNPLLLTAGQFAYFRAAAVGESRLG